MATNLGFKYSYALIKHRPLIEKYEELGYVKGDNYQVEMIKNYNMAALTAIAAGVGIAATGVTTGMSFSQANKQKNFKKKQRQKQTKQWHQLVQDLM